MKATHPPHSSVNKDKPAQIDESCGVSVRMCQLVTPIFSHLDPLLTFASDITPKIGM